MFTAFSEKRRMYRQHALHLLHIFYFRSPSILGCSWNLLYIQKRFRNHIGEVNLLNSDFPFSQTPAQFCISARNWRKIQYQSIFWVAGIRLHSTWPTWMLRFPESPDKQSLCIAPNARSNSASPKINRALTCVNLFPDEIWIIVECAWSLDSGLTDTNSVSRPVVFLSCDGRCISLRYAKYSQTQL